MTRRLIVLLTAVAFTGCERQPDAAATAPLAAPPAASRQQPAGFVAEHDFGVIPHGQQRSADVDVPVPGEGGPWVPVGFQRSCTCARHEFTLIAADGTERHVDALGRGDPTDAVPSGGRLRLTLTIDTLEKEAADLDPTWTVGQVVLQEVSPRARRELLPVRFSFGIRTPLRLVPFAHLDVGEVARSIRYEQAIEIQDRDVAVELGEPQCVEMQADGRLGPAAGLSVRLEATTPGRRLLHIALAALQTRPEGPFAAEVLVPTALPGGYVLRIPVSGTVVPDLQVSPPGWFAFGPIPFDAPRETAVVITDHDLARDADFHVVGIVDAQGVSLTDHFEARIEPIDERPRSRSAVLRYLGTLATHSFRGELLLAKQPAGPAVLRIEFAGFARK